MRKIVAFLFLFGLVSASNLDSHKGYSVYFFGIVQHFYPVPQTNEGNMRYVSVAKKSLYSGFDFESGIGTYVDSYNVNAYKIYTNVGLSGFERWGLKPVFGLAVHSKGVKYGSEERKVFVLPSLKLRVGEERGLFVSFMPIPKFRPYTNGFVAVEVGYSF